MHAHNFINVWPGVMRPKKSQQTGCLKSIVFSLDQFSHLFLLTFPLYRYFFLKFNTFFYPNYSKCTLNHTTNDPVTARVTLTTV